MKPLLSAGLELYLSSTEYRTRSCGYLCITSLFLQKKENLCSESKPFWYVPS